MTVPDIADKLNAVETALKRRLEPTITGSQLLALINVAAPELDVRALVGIPTGPGALTEFVHRHLSGSVERIGNQGGDVLYRVDEREVGLLPPVPSSDIWRTFVSPSSPKHLIMSRSAKRLITRDTPASIDADEVDVPKASSTEHDKIRADFVAALPQSEAMILGGKVAPDADFASWISALREFLPETTYRWGHYRRDRLSRLFAERIRDMQLEEPLQDAILAQVKAAELSAYERSKTSKTAIIKRTMPDDAGRVQDPAEATANARRLAHAAIDLLAYDELRSLKMPLGVMLDAIRAEG